MSEMAGGKVGRGSEGKGREGAGWNGVEQELFISRNFPRRSESIPSRSPCTYRSPRGYTPPFLPGSKKHSDKLSTVFSLVSARKETVSDRSPLPSPLSSFFESLPLLSRMTLGLGIYIVRYISQKINFAPLSPPSPPLLPLTGRNQISNPNQKRKKKQIFMTSGIFGSGNMWKTVHVVVRRIGDGSPGEGGEG